MEYSYMKNVESLLEKGKQKEYSSVSSAMQYVKCIEDALRYVLDRKISVLKRSEVENEPTLAGLTTTTGISLEYLDRYPERVTKSLKRLADYWKPDIKYNIESLYKNLVGTKSGLSVDIVYKLEVFTSIEEFEVQIENYIKQGIEALMQASLIQTSDREILKAMYECFYDSEDADMKKYIERALKKNFYIEFVDFVPETQYANNTYFDVSEAVNIENPVTTRRAIVSKKDNSCIIKGHYVIPKQKVYE